MGTTPEAAFDLGTDCGRKDKSLFTYPRKHFYRRKGMESSSETSPILGNGLELTILRSGFTSPTNPRATRQTIGCPKKNDEDVIADLEE